VVNFSAVNGVALPSARWFHIAPSAKPVWSSQGALAITPSKSSG
jgi:hypothetical protein